MNGLNSPSNKKKSGYIIKPKLVSSYNQSIDNADDKKKLPDNFLNGLPSFILFLLLYVLLLAIILPIRANELFFKSEWPNILAAISSITLILNLLWLISRTGLFTSLGFSLLKLKKITRIERFKNKTIYSKHENPNEGIQTIKEYKQYHQYKTDNTKKWCYISVLLHTILFIISLIILFTLKNI